MRRKLIVSTLAERELHAALIWTLKHYPAHAKRFRAEVREAFDMVREAPLRWALWHEARLRRCLLPHLPYTLYYRVDEDTVVIDAFLHQHQDTTRRFPETP